MNSELLAERDCWISYSALYRWLWQRRQARTVRIGEVAELDWPPGLLKTKLGPAGSAGLLQAQLPVAHLRPEAGGRDRRPGSGLGVLRGIPKYLVIDSAVAEPTHCTYPVPGILPAWGFITDPARVRHPKDKPGWSAASSTPGNAGRRFQGLGRHPGSGPALVSRRRRTAHPRHHPPPAAAGLPGRGAVSSGSLGRRALRSHPLAHRESSHRSPRGLPVRPLFGALHSVSTRAAGGGGPGPKLVLPPGPTGQGPSPSAQGRPCPADAELGTHCAPPSGPPPNRAPRSSPNVSSTGPCPGQSGRATSSSPGPALRSPAPGCRLPQALEVDLIWDGWSASWCRPWSNRRFRILNRPAGRFARPYRLCPWDQQSSQLKSGGQP